MIGVSYHKSLRDLLWEFNEQPVSQATGLVEVGKVGVKGSQGARRFRVMAGERWELLFSPEPHIMNLDFVFVRFWTWGEYPRKRIRISTRLHARHYI